MELISVRNNFDVFPFPDCPKSEKNVDGKDFTQEPVTECIHFFTLSCKCWPSGKEIITFGGGCWWWAGVLLFVFGLTESAPEKQGVKPGAVGQTSVRVTAGSWIPDSHEHQSCHAQSSPQKDDSVGPLGSRVWPPNSLMKNIYTEKHWSIVHFSSLNLEFPLIPKIVR